MGKFSCVAPINSNQGFQGEETRSRRKKTEEREIEARGGREERAKAEGRGREAREEKKRGGRERRSKEAQRRRKVVFEVRKEGTWDYQFDSCHRIGKVRLIWVSGYSIEAIVMKKSDKKENLVQQVWFEVDPRCKCPARKQEVEAFLFNPIQASNLKCRGLSAILRRPRTWNAKFGIRGSLFGYPLIDSILVISNWYLED